MVLLIIGFTALGVLGAYPMVRRKYWKELISFSVLLFAGFSLSFLMVIGVKPPYIGDLLTKFFKSIFHFL